MGTLTTHVSIGGFDNTVGSYQLSSLDKQRWWWRWNFVRSVDRRQSSQRQSGDGWLPGYLEFSGGWGMEVQVLSSERTNSFFDPMLMLMWTLNKRKKELCLSQPWLIKQLCFVNCLPLPSSGRPVLIFDMHFSLSLFCCCSSTWIYFLHAASSAKYIPLIQPLTFSSGNITRLPLSFLFCSFDSLMILMVLLDL